MFYKRKVGKMGSKHGFWFDERQVRFNKELSYKDDKQMEMDKELKL